MTMTSAKQKILNIDDQKSIQNIVHANNSLDTSRYELVHAMNFLDGIERIADPYTKYAAILIDLNIEFNDERGHANYFGWVLIAKALQTRPDTSVTLFSNSANQSDIRMKGLVCLRLANVAYKDDIDLASDIHVVTIPGGVALASTEKNDDEGIARRTFNKSVQKNQSGLTSTQLLVLEYLNYREYFPRSYQDGMFLDIFPGTQSPAEFKRKLRANIKDIKKMVSTADPECAKTEDYRKWTAVLYSNNLLLCHEETEVELHAYRDMLAFIHQNQQWNQSKLIEYCEKEYGIKNLNRKITSLYKSYYNESDKAKWRLFIDRAVKLYEVHFLNGVA